MLYAIQLYSCLLIDDFYKFGRKLCIGLHNVDDHRDEFDQEQLLTDNKYLLLRVDCVCVFIVNDLFVVRSRILRSIPAI